VDVDAMKRWLEENRMRVDSVGLGSRARRSCLDLDCCSRGRPLETVTWGRASTIGVNCICRGREKSANPSDGK
jgi:hypothetical protein